MNNNLHNTSLDEGIADLVRRIAVKLGIGKPDKAGKITDIPIGQDSSKFKEVFDKHKKQWNKNATEKIDKRKMQLKTNYAKRRSAEEAELGGQKINIKKESMIEDCGYSHDDEETTSDFSNAIMDRYLVDEEFRDKLNEFWLNASEEERDVVLAILSRGTQTANSVEVAVVTDATPEDSMRSFINTMEEGYAENGISEGSGDKEASNPLSKRWVSAKGNLTVGKIELKRGKGGKSHTIKRNGKVIGDFSLDTDDDMWVANVKGERGQLVARDIDELVKRLEQLKESVDLDLDAGWDAEDEKPEDDNTVKEATMRDFINTVDEGHDGEKKCNKCNNDPCTCKKTNEDLLCKKCNKDPCACDTPSDISEAIGNMDSTMLLEVWSTVIKGIIKKGSGHKPPFGMPKIKAPEAVVNRNDIKRLSREYKEAYRTGDHYLTNAYANAKSAAGRKSMADAAVRQKSIDQQTHELLVGRAKQAHLEYQDAVKIADDLNPRLITKVTTPKVTTPKVTTPKVTTQKVTTPKSNVDDYLDPDAFKDFEL